MAGYMIMARNWEQYGWNEEQFYDMHDFGETYLVQNV